MGHSRFLDLPKSLPNLQMGPNLIGAVPRGFAPSFRRRIINSLARTQSKFAGGIAGISLFADPIVRRPGLFQDFQQQHMEWSEV